MHSNCAKAIEFDNVNLDLIISKPCYITEKGKWIAVNVCSSWLYAVSGAFFYSVFMDTVNHD